MHPIVVVGAGFAGITVVRELRKLDAATPVVIVADDDGVFYSKPSLSHALSAGKSPSQLVFTQREVLAKQLKAEILARTRVTAIEPESKTMQTSVGPLAYSQLVLATGAHPFRLPLEGSAAEEVLVVNSLDDYVRFRARLESARRVAILGGGLIGCEFASDLAAENYEATVFDIAPQPLGRLLPPQAAAFFRTMLENAGIRFSFGTSVARVDKMAQGCRLLDLAGHEHTADLVLSAIGLVPDTGLAKAAGLSCGRGVAVDRYLRSSAPDIHAVGDCAEVVGQNLPFILPIMEQARALAPTLAGTPTPVNYPAMPVVVKTPACPTVVSPPPPQSEGAWHEEATVGGVRALFRDASGRLLGFALVGDAASEKQILTAQMPPWL